MGSLTWLCVLLALPNVALTEDKVTDKYFADGGSLTLEVNPAFSEHITIILWKFNGNLLAEWVEKLVPLRYYSTFRNRSTLATDTGRLIINNMAKTDEGVYSVGVNNKVQSESYRAVMINKVTKPTVRIRTLTCSAESKSCNVTCEADTEGAEPVTYSWKMADETWKVLKKDIVITNTEHAQLKTLICRIYNDVSDEASDPVPNKLYREEVKTDNGPVIGGVIGTLVFLALAVGGGLFAAWKMKKGPFENRGNTITDAAREQPSAGSGEGLPLNGGPQDSNSDGKEAA